MRSALTLSEPVELFGAGEVSPYGALPWGTRGIIDMTYPFSLGGCCFWHGYWLRDGKAEYHSVRVENVRPIDSDSVSDDEMALLLSKHYETMRIEADIVKASKAVDEV